MDAPQEETLVELHPNVVDTIIRRKELMLLKAIESSQVLIYFQAV